ncbi:MAG TPA: tRNA (adenosine(37)-N6)-threonylcarbamoyltransferase complex ATPase subunit type 1 TsaE [Clostridia bacterium]|nr:tRNA (adenosine(37)-N6)-threonylcarbamoyltransferase complex ATPase subunit type 1 TsaE [Clostridia bacterium]
MQGRVASLKIITHSVAETEEAARNFAKRLAPGDVVAFFGGLGMGKTSFIRGLAAGLGIRDAVSSPTFALVHEYRGPVPLFHFDMYRVGSWQDLDSTGFYDYLESEGICVIEWSENIEEALPPGTIKVGISRGPDDDTRVIDIKENGEDENTGD